MKKNQRILKVDSQLAQVLLGKLRHRQTSSLEFTLFLGEISRILALSAAEYLETKLESVESPLGNAKRKSFLKTPILVPIMRSGNPMLEGLHTLFPDSPAGHIGIYRDKELKATVEYYFRLPKNRKNRPIFLLDPMIATGETARSCVERLREFNVGDIFILSLLISKAALPVLKTLDAKVRIFYLQLESELTPEGLIYPGLGDLGERLYRTNMG